MLCGKVGRQGWADRRVAMDGDRELTGMYLQRVGTALPASLSFQNLRLIQAAEVLDRIKLFGIPQRTFTIRLAYGEKLGDAELAGGAQDVQTVVDEQRPLGVEFHFAAQGVPERLLFLRIAEIMGTDQPLEVGTQLDPLHLQ